VRTGFEVKRTEVKVTVITQEVCHNVRKESRTNFKRCGIMDQLERETFYSLKVKVEGHKVDTLCMCRSGL